MSFKSPIKLFMCCVPTMWRYLILLSICVGFTQSQLPFLNSNKLDHKIGRQQTITIGLCNIIIESSCPNSDVTFFLYTHENQHAGEQIFIGESLDESNLLNTQFKPAHPTKVIIHGYNSDMSLGVLQEIKNEYFLRRDMNIFMVDWSNLAQGPCYPAAVWNSRFAGKCASQLIERIWETGTPDIHIIGFSLGAHAAAFTANNLKAFRIPRITGLDPALPGFATVSPENKLDASDADFVDVIHTNAFIQGVIQQTGHVDFYINGGIVQPGCWAESRFFACSHHRAPLYFAESINTRTGFWGWPCPSYFEYLLGRCLPIEPQIVMGEYVTEAQHGFHLVITNSVSPFAVGKYTGPLIEVFQKKYKPQNVISERVTKASV